MRLAYFSPLNPQKSGIADYSEELLPVLAGSAEIDLFVDGFIPANEGLTRTFQIHDYRRHPECLDNLSHYDALLCQMGNNHRYHRGIYEVARQNPAVIVFHDIAFQHFFLERARELRDASLYLDELEMAEGRRIRTEAEEAMSRGEAPPHYQNPLAFPMNSRFANHAEGIIVHSEWSRARLAPVAPGVPIAKINLAVGIPEFQPEVSQNETLSIASFGFITASKGLESAIRALAALKGDHSFHYYLVGERDNYFDVDQLTRLYDMRDRVSVTGFVNLEEFNNRIGQTDIALNLRDQTVGETSASLCRLMAAGVPTIVSNTGWFSELPDDCVIKIDQGPEGDLLLCTFLKELIEKQQLRKTIGANARQYILRNHRLEQTAASYIEFIHFVIRQRARRKFFDSVSTELACLSNGEPNELLLATVAPALADLTAP
ncbi:MAG TPA: glycosyltransferase family 4 protein [Pyrinomonadaceae bacterium]